MDIHDRILDITAELYDAALDPSLWPQVLCQMCDLLSTKGVHLFVIDHVTGLISFGISHGLDRDAISEYEKHFVKDDPRVEFGLSHPDLKILYDYLHTSETEIDRSEHYYWLQRFGGIRYYFAARLYHNKSYSAYASFNRAPREGHVEPHTLELLSRLTPHLERAIDISQKFSNLNLYSSAASDMLQRLPFGIILLGMDGRVIFVNQTAEAYIAANDGLVIKDRRLSALHRNDDVSLQRLIGANLDIAQNSCAGGSLSVARGFEKRPYFLTISPFPVKRVAFATEYPAVAVLISDPEDSQSLCKDNLQRFFGLTKTEARLACLLFSGQELKDAAKQLSITTKTARLHLEHIFDKTGVHRQAELIILLMRLAMLQPVDYSSADLKL